MSRYCSDKDFDKAVAALVREGWRFESTKRHKKLYPPAPLAKNATMPFLVIPSSPGNHRLLIAFNKSVQRIKEAA